MTDETRTPDEYEVIAPLPTPAALGPKKFMITPLKVGQLPEFARTVKGLNIAPLMDFAETQDFGQIIDLIASDGDRIIKACSIASGISEAEIRNSDMADMVSIVMAVYQVNLDFFRRALPKQAATTTETEVDLPLTAAMNGSGPTPFRVS